MTANEVKPGTRCQCRAEGCPVKQFERDSHGHTYYVETQSQGSKACRNHAVRLVTVVRKVHKSAFFVTEKGSAAVSEWAETWPVPMCAACAEYHERAKAERETASAIHAIHGMPGEPEPEGGQE